MAKFGKHKMTHGKKVPTHHHHGKNQFKRGGKVSNGLALKDSGHPDQAETESKEEYNARGSHIMAEGQSRKDAFKGGGKVMGCKSKARMDKYARGGRAGGSPFSSAKIKENTAAAK